jgi:hypothetical protein
LLLHASKSQYSLAVAVVVEHPSTGLIVSLDEQEIYRIRLEDGRGGLQLLGGGHMVVS